MSNSNSDNAGALIVGGAIVLAVLYFALKSYADPLGLSVRALVYIIVGVVLTLGLWLWRAFNYEALAAAALIPFGFALSFWRAVDEWAGVYSESYFSQHIAWYGNGYIQFAVFAVLAFVGSAYYWKNKSWEFYL